MALSKTGRFLTEAEILGVGVFSPLSKGGGVQKVCAKKFVRIFSSLFVGVSLRRSLFTDRRVDKAALDKH